MIGEERRKASNFPYIDNPASRHKCSHQRCEAEQCVTRSMAPARRCETDQRRGREMPAAQRKAEAHAGGHSCPHGWCEVELHTSSIIVHAFRLRWNTLCLIV